MRFVLLFKISFCILNKLTFFNVYYPNSLFCNSWDCRFIKIKQPFSFQQRISQGHFWFWGPWSVALLLVILILRPLCLLPMFLWPFLFRKEIECFPDSVIEVIHFLNFWGKRREDERNIRKSFTSSFNLGCLWLWGPSHWG